MPRIYKRYLYTSGAVPRTTAYRHRRRQQERERAQQGNNESVLTVQVDSTLHIREGNNTMQRASGSSSEASEQEQDLQADRVHYLCDAQISLREYLTTTDESTSVSSVDDPSEDVSVEELSEGDSLFPNAHKELEALSTNDSESYASFGDVCVCEHDLVGDSTTRNSSDDMYGEVLCWCTQATAGDAMLMCLALGLRHNLTWVAQVDILKMINSLYGKEVVPATMYFFLKFVERDNENTVLHFFCPSCEAFIGKVSSVSERGTIECSCGELVKMSDASTYFVSVGLESQFRELFKNEDVVNALDYRFTRKKDRADALEDIYDGAEYQKHCTEGGILSHPLNFSYSFNTDGIPFGISSKQTIWPVYVRLNELPLKLRAKNVLLAGLWVGKKDPKMTNFLQPFVSEANKLSSDGMS